MIKFCRDREKLGSDRNCRRIENGQGNCVTTQQARGIREERSVATKKFQVAIEIVKDLKKSCRDRESSVATELTG